MKLADIFEHVGLTAEQIRDLTKTGAPPPPVAVQPTKVNVERRQCPVCGRPIGTQTCVMIASRRGNSAQLNAHPSGGTT